MDPTKITEIGLERTACFGTCPVDRVTLRANGTATYLGRGYVARIGVHEGVFWPQHFRRLAELVAYVGFFDMERRYPVNGFEISNFPSKITRAVGDGMGKAVWHQDVSAIFEGAPCPEGLLCPIGLWAVEMAILGVAETIQWRSGPHQKGDRKVDPAGDLGNLLWDRELDG